jgi:hypothetical protein
MSSNEVGVRESVGIVTRTLHALERTDPDTLMEILDEIDVSPAVYAEAIKTIKSERLIGVQKR